MSLMVNVSMVWTPVLKATKRILMDWHESGSRGLDEQEHESEMAKDVDVDVT